ncbi:MAG: cation:proton antiporter [Ignavibacteria bacterium]|nr:cation:proton antiporter [Ignavibacteria bacterium]
MQKILLPSAFIVFSYQQVFASTGSVDIIPQTFLWIVIALLVARLGGFVEKFGQPAVLGELIAGAIIGNMILINVPFFEGMKSNEYLHFLAEMGVVILLFQVGLESNVHDMKKVGFKALLVASVGILLPFVLGRYIAGPMLMPGLTEHAYLFLGATLSATSVGITARVFKDFSMLHSKEARIVLGAAVIDDVMGLVLLAIVSSIVQTGTVSMMQVVQTIGLSIALLAGGTIIGGMIAKPLSKWLSILNPGSAMKLGFALSVGFAFAYIAHMIGLAPIVGAFTAGLMLDSVHFKYFQEPGYVSEFKRAVGDADKQVQEKVQIIAEEHHEKHIEHIIEPIGHFLSPIFFVMTGLAVDVSVFMNGQTLVTALVLTGIAIIGKLASGFFAGKGVNHWLIGWGMVPRGEVGLIFASVGRALGVVDITEYSVIVVVILLTTFVTPPILGSLVKNNQTS